MREEALLLLLMALRLDVPPLGIMFAVLIGAGRLRASLSVLSFGVVVDDKGKGSISVFSEH